MPEVDWITIHSNRSLEVQGVVALNQPSKSSKGEALNYANGVFSIGKSGTYEFAFGATIANKTSQPITVTARLRANLSVAPVLETIITVPVGQAFVYGYSAKDLSTGSTQSLYITSEDVNPVSISNTTVTIRRLN